MKSFSTLAITAILIAACSTPESRVQEKFPDRPPSYREGYKAGCDIRREEVTRSAKSTVRDEKRIQSDSSYANGWYDGYSDCENGENHTQYKERHDSTQPVRTEGGW